MRKSAACLLATTLLAGCPYSPLPVPTRRVDGGHAGPAVDAGAAVLPDAGNVLRTAPLRTPPLEGGSMIALRSGALMIASADLDRVYEVATPDLAVTRRVSLPVASDPGRLVEDGAGRVHVVLRSDGAVATLEPGADEVTVRRICAAPRGIAWRESDDALVVACAEGVLVTLPAAGGPALATTPIAADDLRDVVLAGDRVLVSRFRSAEVLAVAQDGTIAARWSPATSEVLDLLDPTTTATATMVPHVAWRMIAAPGGAQLVHQRERVDIVPLGFDEVTTFGGDLGGYQISPLVECVVSFVDASAPSGTLAEGMRTLLPHATDLALSDDGELVVISTHEADERYATASMAVRVDETWATFEDAASLSSVVFVGSHRVLLDRDPARLRMFLPGTVGFPDERTLLLDVRVSADPSRRVFETVTRSGLACVSCHPEGGDDGHVWHLVDTVVRTPSLVGGVLSSAPFGWRGDLGDFPQLISELYFHRMGGRGTQLDVDALGAWVDTLEAAPRPPGSPSSIARGRTLFESATVGCAGCHVGEGFSNETTVDVGTGDAFQVPRLTSVVSHAPYMHDGCAAALRDRFTADAACTGGDMHGHTSDLAPNQIDDLVTYMESL